MTIIQERVKAGLARARVKGKTLGRPRTSPKIESKIRKLAAAGMGKQRIARTLMDVAKGVFQMYWVDGETGEIVNQRFRRHELIGFLAQRPASRVALEACGSGHWWARKIKTLGHEAGLVHASFIRPFVQTNKTDAADAKAIWTAVNQPAMRTVAVKTQAP